MNHFEIGDDVYSVLVPMPGDRWRFDPMDEREARWRPMGKSVNAAYPRWPGSGTSTTTAVPPSWTWSTPPSSGNRCRRSAQSQPWHGGRIVILARNNPRQACLRCGQPAHWKAAPEYDEFEEYDDELYDDEGVLCADDLGPHHLMRGVCASSRGTGPAAQLSPGGRELL